MAKHPIFIFGYGRSGTNWLLNLMSLNPETHCRNEPDEIRSSPLAHLPYSDVGFKPDTSFGNSWDKSIHWTATHFGERDRMPQNRKAFLYSFLLWRGIIEIIEKRKIRILLSCTSPSLIQPEWGLPWWFGPRHGLNEAQPILKIAMKHNWAIWVLNNRPDSKIIHIVRHPGGVLQSWRKRYLANRNHAKVLQANVDRLQAIADLHPKWANYFGDLSTISVEEAEMWFWRYSTEALSTQGSNRKNYRLILYEQIITNLFEEISRIYKFCGLSLSDEIMERIDHSNQPQRKKTQWNKKIVADSSVASKWRQTISKTDKKILNKVLQGSMLEHWWS